MNYNYLDLCTIANSMKNQKLSLYVIIITSLQLCICIGINLNNDYAKTALVQAKL